MILQTYLKLNKLNNKLNIMKQILHKTLGLRAWMMVAMLMAAKDQIRFQSLWEFDAGHAAGTVGIEDDAPAVAQIKAETGMSIPGQNRHCPAPFFADAIIADCLQARPGSASASVQYLSLPSPDRR